MAGDYRVFVHFEALQTLPSSGARRRAVVEFLQMLGGIAYLGGDLVVEDPRTGRPFQMTQRGFALTWWIDAPVGEVKVVDIAVVG